MSKSKIQLNQINENTVEVHLSSDAPMEVVSELTKSLTAKGLVEDLRKSTVGKRHFYRPQHKVNDIADELIKSLKGLSKDDNPYSKASQFANQARNNAADKQARITAPGIAASNANRAKIISDGAKNAAKQAASTPTAAPKPKGMMGFFKEECNCEDKKNCLCVEKSNYGPKGGGQYSPDDNAKRKINNVGEVDAAGPNKSIKQYTSAPFGNKTGYQTDPKLKKPQPVKVYSKEEKEAMASKMGLKKSWVTHNSVPNADEEVTRLERRNGPTQTAEDLMANQLANMMSGKAMLGNKPPAQPTDEEMFGSGVVTEEMAKAATDKWNNTMNWLEEATKPISARFASEEEEVAYWKNLGGVSDRDDGKSGY